MTIQRIYLSIIAAFLFLGSCSKDDPPVDNPVTASGTLYSVGCGGVYSFDLGTGTFNWKKSTNIGGESGTPAYDSGALYLADPYGVCALNAKDGSFKWKLPYSPLTGFYSGEFKGRLSPIVVDSIVYTIGFEGTNFKIDLYAIHKSKGTILWQNLLFVHTDDLSQPIITGNKLIIVKVNEIVCFNRISGQQLWSTPCASIGLTPSFYPVSDNSFLYVHDKVQNKIVVISTEQGTVTRTLTLPAAFDGQYMTLKGQQLYSVSKTDFNSTFTNLYVIDKNSGNLVKTTKVAAQNPYVSSFSAFFNNAPGGDYLLGLTSDASNLYLYNPITAMAFDLTTNNKIWESELPLKKVSDSTNGSGVITSTQPIITPNNIIFLSSYRYTNINTTPPTVQDKYRHVDLFDKTGKPVKSLPLDNLGCLGVPFYYMVVQDGRGYYPSVDLR